MSSRNLICFILLGFCSLSVFGACPFGDYTNVVTACTGDNDMGIVYPAGTSANEVDFFPLRPNKRTGKGYTHGIGCLDETPSPAWFAIKIDEPGDLLINISHSKGADIDYACWGPFSGESKQAMLENVCAHADKFFEDCVVPTTTNTCRQSKMEQCESSFAVRPGASEIEKIQSRVKIAECKMEVDEHSKTDPDYECFYGNYDAFPIAQMADCSFSNSAIEPCFIGSAKRCDWYIILVTNFSGVSGNILFNQVGGNASTDCNVIVDAGSNSPVCEGEKLELFMNNIPAYSTVKWTGPNGFESTEYSPSIAAVSSENAGTYYVQITTHDGLKSEEFPVKVSIITNTPIDTTLRLVEGETVSFMDKEFNKPGTYEVKVENGKCVRLFNVNVTEVPLLPTYIVQNGPLCEDETLVLTIEDVPESGVEGYEWNGPNGFRSYSKSVEIPKMTPNKAGKYSLKIKVEGLFYPVAPVDVKVISKEVHKVFQHVSFGESIEFNGEVIDKRGLYTATFQSVEGCDSIVELYLFPDVPELIPDEFITPNGDGENDVWNIKNIEYCPEAVVRIYDRNGKKLYEQTEYGPENAWDGTDGNGRKLPSTDYWYTIDVQSADKVYSGHFSLMR